MRIKIAIEVTLDEIPANRKLSKDEKAIISGSVLTRYKPKPAILECMEGDQAWYMPLVNDGSLIAWFDHDRYPTPAEILEIEIKAREICPEKFN